jgi:hypothetical protein
MDASLACRTLGWLRRNPMLWSALDPIPTNSMLWPSPASSRSFGHLSKAKKRFPKTAILIATSDQQAMAVGRTVAQWAYYEHLLNCFLIDLLKPSEAQGIRKSIRMTFGKRMELWRELAQRSHTTEPDRSVVADLIQQTETAHGMRDKIVHGIGWALSDRIDCLFFGFQTFVFGRREA